MIYFSASNSGFYRKDIHGDAIPADAVEITEARHQEMMAGQAKGLIISSGLDGHPILVEPTPLTPEQVADAVTAARAQAYRSEADPLFFKAQRGEATMEEWAAKVAEIKARYPDGVMPS
ncbi:hypothetical protein B9Z43_01435 [Limnohabitans sp. MMS-10A-192]|uniref:hypothetical protein n=1 Tax=Limnohabitans sp. MMS-10A-192 TaxID=1835769 RepID=UPI000D34B88E|nr:hypothetical protein [Limnohabitans sp. MMS-10A-192]PUE21870.1 hypothetical protein B9Z43_01435 [Limnohabitans sp. MMS-10A-192]